MTHSSARAAPRSDARRSSRGLLGWSVSAQYVGQVLGPLTGGFVGGHTGMRAVFLGTAVLMAAGALANAAVEQAVGGEAL